MDFVIVALYQTQSSMSVKSEMSSGSRPHNVCNKTRIYQSLEVDIRYTVHKPMTSTRRQTGLDESHQHLGIQ